MAQDPLGLVYTGQDGTGAAFKAPWTSYDPYSAEVRRGAMLGQVEALKQKKKEADDAEYFKATAGATSNWDLQNTGKLNYWNNRLQSDFTKLYQQNQGAITPQVQEALSRAKIMSAELKATSDAQGKAREETVKLISSPNADTNFNTALTRQNIGVFDNPYAAPSSIYPEIQPQLASYEERIRLANRNNPMVDDKMVKYMAEDAWRANEGKEFLAPIEHRSFSEKIKTLQGLRNIEESKYTKMGNGEAYTDYELKKFRPELAKSLVANDFATDHAWRRTVSDEWANSPEKEKYANPLEYAQAKLLPHLLVDEVKSTSRNPQDYNSKWGTAIPEGVNLTAGEYSVNHEYKPAIEGGEGAIFQGDERGFTVTVGSKTNQKEPVFQISSTTYFPGNDIANPQKTADNSEFTLQRLVKKPALIKPVTLTLSDLKKPAVKTFVGKDLKSLIKQANEGGGSVTIDLNGVPLDRTAVSVLQNLGHGDAIGDRVYGRGNMEVQEADPFGKITIKKLNGVYVPEEDIRNGAMQEMLGMEYMSALNNAYPDKDYSKSATKKPSTSSSQGKGGSMGKSSGETYDEWSKRTGKTNWSEYNAS